MKDMIMTLKDKSKFNILEIVYSKMYTDEKRAYIIRMKCEDSESIQDLFNDVSAAFTEDNISNVTIGVDDESRADNTFNFTKVISIDFHVTDAITVLEVIIE